MSHFTVMVISKDGDDIDELLAPFNEQPEEDDKFCQLEWSCEGADGNHYGPYDSKELLEESLKEEGTTVAEGPWCGNSDAHWDWYVVGGRWQGMLRLKELAKSGIKGRPGTMGAPDLDPTTADSALKEDIDFDSMFSEAMKEATIRYANAMEIFGELPVHKSLDEWWDYYVKKMPDGTDRQVIRTEASKSWSEQPRVIAFAMAKEANEKFRLDADDFLMTEEVYVRKAKANTICTHSVLENGQWDEQGSMGWFGMSSDNVDQESWEEQVLQRIEAMSDDTRITIVDCHI